MTLILDMASGASDWSDDTLAGPKASRPDPTLLAPASPLTGLQEIRLDTDRLSGADKAAIRQHLLQIRHDTD